MEETEEDVGFDKSNYHFCSIQQPKQNDGNHLYVLTVAPLKLRWIKLLWMTLMALGKKGWNLKTRCGRILKNMDFNGFDRQIRNDLGE